MKRAVLGLLLLLVACGNPTKNNPPLVTVFDAETEGLEATFSWQVIEPDGDVFSCQLDVDSDGVIDYLFRDCSNIKKQVHRYPAPGEYQALLIADDGMVSGNQYNNQNEAGQKSFLVKVLAADNSHPEIDEFKLVPRVGQVPFATTFTWLVFDREGDGLSCSLDPADGSSIYQLEDCKKTTLQSHVYARAGIYQPVLRVFDGGGGQVDAKADAKAESDEVASNILTVDDIVNPDFLRGEFLQMANGLPSDVLGKEIIVDSLPESFAEAVKVQYQTIALELLSEVASSMTVEQSKSNYVVEENYNSLANENTVNENSLAVNSVAESPVIVLSDYPKQVKTGQQVIFDAAQSYDSSQSGLTFSWRWLEHPTPTPPVVSLDASVVTFSPEVAGIYSLELLLSNGTRVGLETVKVLAVENKLPSISWQSFLPEQQVSDNALQNQGFSIDSFQKIGHVLGEDMLLSLRVIDEDAIENSLPNVKWSIVQKPAASLLHFEQPQDMNMLEGGNANQMTHQIAFLPDVAGMYKISVVAKDEVDDVETTLSVFVFDHYRVTSSLNEGWGSLRWGLEHVLRSNKSQANQPVTIEVAVQDDIVLTEPLPDIIADVAIVFRSSSDDLLNLQAVSGRRIFTVATGASLQLQGFSLHGSSSLQETEGGAVFVAAGGKARLENCVITGNSAQVGGAIFNAGELALENCELMGNIAIKGGSIASAVGSNTTLKGVTMMENQATELGGAAYFLGEASITAGHILQNQAGNVGGGLWSSAALELTDTVIDANQAVQAGGIYVAAGLDGVGGRLEQNLARQNGGGIYIDTGANARFEGTKWQANVSSQGQGGGAYVAAGGSLNLAQNNLLANQAAAFGGGISAFGRATLKETLLSGNQAGRGGAVSVAEQGHLILQQSLLQDNAAVEFAGGIANFATVEIDSCTLTGNSAPFGGAILSGIGAVRTQIGSSTIVANQANQGGAGILHGAGQTTLANSIVIANVSQENTPDCAHTQDTATRIVLQPRNIIRQTGGCEDARDDSMQTATIISVQTPLQQLLLPLADNGGNLPTYALAAGSVAIDAGVVNNVVASDYDQRGVGYPRVLGKSIDIGAFEARP